MPNSQWKIKWRISESVFKISTWSKRSSFSLFQLKAINFAGSVKSDWCWFLPYHLETGRSLSLPAYVCLFVPMPICLSNRPSLLPNSKLIRAITREFFFFFFKLGSNILWVTISNKFEYGYRSSFDVDIINWINFCYVLSCLHINSQPPRWVYHECNLS